MIVPLVEFQYTIYREKKLLELLFSILKILTYWKRVFCSVFFFFVSENNSLCNINSTSISEFWKSISATVQKGSWYNDILSSTGYFTLYQNEFLLLPLFLIETDFRQNNNQKKSKNLIPLIKHVITKYLVRKRVKLIGIFFKKMCM